MSNQFKILVLIVPMPADDKLPYASLLKAVEVCCLTVTEKPGLASLLACNPPMEEPVPPLSFPASSGCWYSHCGDYITEISVSIPPIPLLAVKPLSLTCRVLSFGLKTT